ncbi:MAG: hypothetical protein KGY99_03500 [Phycisphaerae bacterium]|nr:hypothetical protein [Phycisphaerae bacterium]
MTLQDALHQALWDTPVLDPHTHVNRDRMTAAGLHQIVFYHMQMYMMRGAGVDELAMWPEQECIDRGLPFEQWARVWRLVRRSGFAWILQTILRDLYGFDEPPTAESLPRLHEAFKRASDDPGRARRVLERARVVRLCSSKLDVAPLEPGQWDGDIRFTIEDMPLAGKTDYTPWSAHLETLDATLGRDVTSADDLREAVAAYYADYDWTGRNALVAWVGAEADFTPVGDAEINRIIAAARSGGALPLAQRRLLEAAYIRAIAAVARDNTRVFQFCYGTQYVTPEPQWAHPIQKAAGTFAATAGYLFGEFPELHFNVLNGYEPDEPIWCSLVPAYANVSLSNFWWQTFYPSVMRRAVQRRLDVVPLNKLVGFFSDGWCVEYVYGRLAMVRRVWADALAERIERGLMTRDEALTTARQVFFETPRELFFPDEPLEE